MTITFAFGPIKMFLNPNINLALHEAFEAVVRIKAMGQFQSTVLCSIVGG